MHCFWISGRPLSLWVAVITALILATEAIDQTPTFGDTIDILGNMERTDQDFQDGLVLDLFSPKNRTLVVKQNLAPLSGQFVSGTTGEGFIALSNYSYIIKMNETANDLIAKIEIPFDSDMLAQIGIQESNTYVGTLAQDRKSWVVDETRRNVHRAEKFTRIIKMTSLDGEFILLGRQSVDTTNIFVQYGQGATRTVNITKGFRQEAEFIDGLRFSMIAQSSLAMNVDIRNGIVPGSVPSGMVPVNSFVWVVNTSDPGANMSTTLSVPVNQAMVTALHTAGPASAAHVMVAKRKLGANTAEAFQIIGNSTKLADISPVNLIKIASIEQIDGEYMLLTGCVNHGNAKGQRNCTAG